MEIDIDQALLMQTFAAEAEEQLAVMEQGLCAIEQRPDDADLLASVFRAAHTLKGNAGTVGLHGVAARADVIEDALDTLRAGRTAASPVLISELLRALDALRKELGTAVATEGSSGSVQIIAPAHGTTLRIDAAKLDRMLSLSGELSIARGRLRTHLVAGGPGALHDALESHLEADRLYRDLQDEIMRARLVPLGPIFRQYQRVVRDLALEHHKRAELLIEGEDVEIDTAVGERVRGPIMHMLRNALDHGIESPERRRACGKDPVGRIILAARRDASHIVIELRDDGAGFSRDKIAARAGLDSVTVAELDDRELLAHVFAPGFSTAEARTALSGRGVGMDVVRRNIEALRGAVAIRSEEGQGSTVTLRLPLTLAIIDGFFVEVGGETYVLPLEAVTECQQLSPEDVRHADGSGVLNFRGQPLPYLRLRELFALDSASTPEREHIAIVKVGERYAGIAVDGLLGQDQAVIKPLGPLFRDVPAVAGSTIGGNGRVALILDVAALLDLAEARSTLSPARRSRDATRAREREHAQG
jgi:two-component system, chemotaxis family, sensor kinase CheA